jgi:hypothetical protein
MSRPRDRKKGNPDLRRQHNPPALAIPELEEKILSLVEPSLFTPLKYLPGNHDHLMRDRLLTLPVLVALVVGIVYRQIAGLSQAVRMLNEEGLLWVKPLKVSKQAVSKRFLNFPAEIFAALLKGVLEKAAERESSIELETRWQKIRERFSAVWVADGSTLEELRKRLKIDGDKGTRLGGKIMMIVSAFTATPVTVWYSENDKSNDKVWCDDLRAKLPKNGLLIVDLGFFSFPWFDELTTEGKFFLTRVREKTSLRVQKVLSRGTYYKDEIVLLGTYRSNPCQHPVRVVSVLWGDTWYRYLTNVLSPELLSPRDICDLYRGRWSIESAFLLIKRLLGLSYLWVGHANGVQIQILCTLIFYTVLNQLVGEVAVALRQPKEKISVEMVFRSLYYVAKAFVRGENPDVVSYLAERAKLFGLIKAERQRHREKEALSRQIWQAIPLS